MGHRRGVEGDRGLYVAVAVTAPPVATGEAGAKDVREGAQEQRSAGIRRRPAAADTSQAARTEVFTMPTTRHHPRRTFSVDGFFMLPKKPST